MTSIGNEAKFFVIFSLLPLKNLVISCLAPGNSTLYFFNVPGKPKSWNSQLSELPEENSEFYQVLFKFVNS